MKKIYYLFPVLYIIIVLALFSNYIIDSQQRKYQWGNVSIQITAKDKEHQKLLSSKTILPAYIPIRNIQIDMPQIKMNFQSHLNIAKNNKNSFLTSISALPSGEGFLLHFGEDIYISFQTNVLHPEEIAIIVYAKKQDSIHIPVRTIWGTQVSFDETILRLTTPKESLNIIASPNASFIQKNNDIIFSTKDTYASFRFSGNNTQTLKTISQVPKISPAIKEETNKVVSGFIDNAYNGWVEKRLDDALSTWYQPEGFYIFSENILTAAYTESIRRQTLVKYKLELDKAAVVHKNALTWRTAFFNQKAPDIFLSIFEDAKEIQGLALSEINKRNRNIINELDIWRTLPFWHQSSRQTFFNFIQTIEAINISSENSAMLLYQSAKVSLPIFQQYIEKNKFVLEQNLMSNVVVINHGYMLVGSKNNINTRISIIAGAYLSQYGSTKEMKRLGYRILKTTLLLGDDSGFLPRILIDKEDGLVALGYITPEEIYPFISNNIYDANIKLTNISGIYSFSSAVPYLKKENNTLDITLDTNIKESTEFIYLWPIERPISMHGFNLYWSGNTFASNITKGISYDNEHKLLTIKILHWDDAQSIKIVF